MLKHSRDGKGECGPAVRFNDELKWREDSALSLSPHFGATASQTRYALAIDMDFTDFWIPYN